MKKNVLQFIDSFHQGGSERQAVQLTELLREEGTYNIYLATLDRNGILRDKIEKIGLPPIPEFRLKTFYDLNFLRQLGKCVTFMRANKIHIVHTHDFYTNIFGILSAFFARVPVRIASRRETSGIRTRGQKHIERGVYRFAHAIVANAEAVREHLIKEGIETNKIEVIYNGLDIGRVTPISLGKSDEERRKILDHLGIPRDAAERLVTIVANFRLDVKDHPTFLRAASRVQEVVPNVNFILVGEGPLLNSMRILATQLGLEKSAFFTGQYDSVAELLAISDVCVLSSKAEGLSNAILEYMAAGRPVVVTDVGGANEMVLNGETGYLVNSGDDLEMAERIILLLNQPDTAKTIGECGRNTIVEKFSCATQVQRTQNLYNRLLANQERSIRP